MYKDYENYKEFRRIVREELNNPNSVFSSYNIQHNKRFTKIGCIVNLQDECAQIDEYSKLIMVSEKVTPLVKHIDLDLNLFEYLYMPKPDEIMMVEDDNKTIKPTLSYVVEYHFVFQNVTWINIIKLISCLGILTTIITYAIQ